MTHARETWINPNARFGSKVGLLAGGGSFPIHFAESARRAGIQVACVAIRDHADPELASACDEIAWTGLGRLGRMIRLFRRWGVERVVMAGKIHKAKVMYDPWRWWNLLPDWRFLRMWFLGRRPDNRDDSVLLAVIDEFRKDGLLFASALEICPDLLAPEGILTRRAPSASQLADIVFGWDLAREMGRLDVGQAVAIKERSAIAIEAVEGTDRMIERSGQLCPAGGFVVVKVAKPEQDMRFDVPTVGVQTIESIIRARGSVLAIEAGRTILIDRERVIELANHHGLAIHSTTDAAIAKLRPGAVAVKSTAGEATNPESRSQAA